MRTWGIDYPLWLPLLAGFSVSFFCAMAGISGAFLLVPFQTKQPHSLR